MTDKPSAASSLRQMAEEIDARTDVYGEVFKTVGKVLQIVTPSSFKPETPAQYSTSHLFGWTIGKLCRYAASGFTHQDSIKDAGAYCALMLQVNQENSNE